MPTSRDESSGPEDDEESMWVDEDKQVDWKRSGGANSKAAKKKRRRAREAKVADLEDDIREWHQEREARAAELAKKHSVHIKHIRRKMMWWSKFTPDRKPNLYNAKVSAIMRDLNRDCAPGNKYTIPQTKQLIKEDLTLLEGFTEEEEKEMLDEMVKNSKTKKKGARASKQAVVLDTKWTIGKLWEEMTSLANRTGTLGFAVFSRGDAQDRQTATAIDRHGAMKFFLDVFQKTGQDITGLFELWAVSHNKDTPVPDSLHGLQVFVRDLVRNGLRIITKKPNLAMNMNWENYPKAIVQKYSVRLMNWPAKVPFKRMSQQSTIGDLRVLRDTFLDGSCQWVSLNKSQQEEILKEFEDKVESGKRVEKERKRRSDIHGTHRRRSSQSKSGKSKSRVLDDSDEEEVDKDGEDDEDDSNDGCGSKSTKSSGSHHAALPVTIEAKHRALMSLSQS
ncbi:hypothetical protein C8R45DRAFT_1114915 [Mycena sanguinolenta]|nr:hypothetical protein C8R45DRAFT_1114915 [Mycena sanguinolenta]